jgi:hypothetical protein
MVPRLLTRLAPAALILSVACSGGGGGLFVVDNDGDGVEAEQDCDDSDPNVYPGADEVWDDGIDQDCDGVADVEDADCSADLAVTFPDGTTTTLDGCVDWAFDAAFEFDPDDPPEIIDFTLRLGGTDQADFDCQVDLIQPGICGPGYYRHVAGASAVVVLLDCTGVDDAYEDTFTASDGYLRIDTIDAGSTPGTFAGVPLVATLEGYLHLKTRDGIEVEGEISLTRVQVAGDGEEQKVCVGVDGDADNDGFVDAALFDGDDCNDEDSSTFPGAAELDDPTACMQDLDDDGWGNNAHTPSVERGQDCDDTDPRTYPVDTDGDGQVDACGWTQIAAGQSHTCVLHNEGGVYCWGHDRSDQVSGAPSELGYGFIGAGGGFNCAGNATGELTCWGADGSHEKTSGAPDDDGWEALGLGEAQGCAVDGAGAVTCWGRSGYDVAQPTVPVFTQLSGGFYHQCGLDSSGGIWCWGDGSYDTDAVLFDVPGGTFEEVDCGNSYCCGLTTAGGLACWGDDEQGQVSDAPSGTGYTHVNAGAEHACALDGGGEISCWGNNDHCQASCAPSSSGWLILAAGTDHTCAIGSGGTEVECWGSNDDYQLYLVP